jgi:hypothetical protein
MDWKSPPASDTVTQTTRTLPFVESVLTVSDTAKEKETEEIEIATKN